MGMTMTQKILAAHAGVDSVKAGDLITCSLDLVMANDITAPPSIAEFKRIGRPVFDKDKIVLVPDHFQPAKDIKSAGLAKIVRDFAREHHITHYFEQGRVGIEHALLPEKGLVGPGMVTIGADSHTCTYGALGGFSTGVGSTDLGVAMAIGRAWFKVPDGIKVTLTGAKPSDITGKDVILKLIGMIGVVFCVKQIFYVIEHDSKIVLRKRFVCREYLEDSQQGDEQQVFYLHFGIS